MISWPNHSRNTLRSPNIASKWGSSDSMSIRVSLTSNTRTEGRLGIRMAAFLKCPGVAVRVGHISEAGVIGPLRIDAETEAALPLARLDVLVPDGADADASIDEFVAHCGDVAHHQVQAPNRAGWRVGQPDAELDRRARSPRSE